MHLEMGMLLDTQVGARCRVGLKEASLELGRHPHLGGLGREKTEETVGGKTEAREQGLQKGGND